MKTQTYASSADTQTDAAANGSGLSRRLLPAEPTTQPPRQPSAVAELGVVRRLRTSSMNLRSLLSVAVFAVAFYAFYGVIGMVVTLGWNGAFVLPTEYSWPQFFLYQTVCCAVLLLFAILLLCCRRRVVARLRLPPGWSLAAPVAPQHFLFAAFLLLGGYFAVATTDAIFMRYLENAPYRGDTSVSHNLGLLVQIIAFAFLGITMLARPDLWFRIAYDSTNVA